MFGVEHNGDCIGLAYDVCRKVDGEGKFLSLGLMEVWGNKHYKW